MSLLRVTWEVTQWEMSDLAKGEERGGRRKAAIMWRVNTSAVGEQRRLKQREGEEKKKKTEIITLQFACGDTGRDEIRGDGRKKERGQAFLSLPLFIDLPGLEM